MLMCKGVELNFDKDPKDLTPAEKWVLGKKEQLVKDYGEAPWIIKYCPEMVKPDPDNRGKKLFPKEVDVLFNAKVKSETGTQNWAYFTHFEPIIGTDKEQTAPRKMSFNGYKEMHSEDWELAVFLRYISPLCKDNKTEDGKAKSTRHYFVFENIKLDTAEFATVARKKAQLNALIWGEASPLTKEGIVTLLLSYNIPFSKKEEKMLDTLRKKLDETLVMRQIKDRKTIDNFLKDVNLDEEVKFKAKCNKLFVDEIVVIDNKTNKLRLKNTVDTTKPGEVLCSKKMGEDERVTLLNFLKKNVEKAEDLFTLLK